MTFRKASAIVCIPIICLVIVDFLTALKKHDYNVLMVSVSNTRYSKGGMYVSAEGKLPSGEEKTYKVKTASGTIPEKGKRYNATFRQGLVYRWDVKLTPTKPDE